MKIATIIPLSKGVFKESLSYFTSLPVKPGSLVTVPLKKGQASGLVIDVTDAVNLKTVIKKTDYTLKKITTLKAKSFFLPEFIEACFKTADFYATTPGQIMTNYIPKAILIGKSSFSIKLGESPTNGLKAEKLILQENEDGRLSFYKSLIRESFAKKNSVFFCLPTISEIERLMTGLEKGIVEYTFILHGKMTAKKIIDTWQSALAQKHPILIAATPLFLSLPRSDVKTIVFEKESSSTYKNQVRPFVDSRILAENLAEARKIKIILGDDIPRAETVHRFNQGELIPATPAKFRSLKTIEQDLIDLSGGNLIATEKSLVEKIIAMVENSRNHHEKLFILSARRGLSSATVCGDCGTIVSCQRCQSPIILHNNKGKRFFLCHRCGQAYETYDKCPNCGGWRLATLGEGIEKIETIIEKQFPGIPLFKIDSDNVKNPKKAKDIIDKFITTAGSVLLGTDMALSYLNQPIENCAVVSIDSLLTIPDFRINEKVFGRLLKVRQLSDKRFFILTRNVKHPIYNHTLSGNLLDFYREELSEREKMGYPPFKTIIKISLTGQTEKIETAMSEVENKLKAWDPIVFSSPRLNKKGQAQVNLLIKLNPENWPQTKLADELKELTPNFVIDVNPEEIF